MLTKLNDYLQKTIALLIPVSLIIGVIFADAMDGLAFLIPWIFAFMTFAGSLSSNFASMKQAVLNPKPLILAIFILHIFMPLWALGMGHLVYSHDVHTITGLVLVMAIPTGITSFVWTAISRGHAILALTIILVDTLLSPVVVPLTLSLLLGANVEMDVFSMAQGLIFMIVLPSIAGMVLHEMTKGKVAAVWSPRLAPFSKLGMGAVVMLNGSVVAPYLIEVDLKLVGIAAMVFFIAFCGYTVSFLVGVLFKQDKETVIALVFSGGMRNISAGAVLAVSYFPAAVAVPVVLGMLFQQTLASTFGYMINRFYHKEEARLEQVY